MTKQPIKVIKTGQDSLSLEMQKLGFTDYEARVYIYLLTSPPATAYEVSKNSGIPRSNTYNTIDSLVQRGVLQPVSRDPDRYAAIEYPVLLDRILSSTRAVCNDLSSRFSALDRPVNSGVVWTARGEANVYEKLRSMIAAASDNIWIKASEEILRALSPDLKAAAKRGVQTIIVLFGVDPTEFKFGRKSVAILHEGNGKRNGVADNLFTIAIDHREVLAASLGADIYATFTENPTIVTMAETMIRHEYYLAEMFVAMGPEIDANFGPHLQSLRHRCFTAEQYERFRTSLGME
jgi:sugar-specific transcriptional regulator TrmB